MAAPPIWRAHRWQNNAELVADVAALWHFDRSWPAVDLTYGGGKWWKRWRPDQLVCHDADKSKGGDGVNYQCLPDDDDTYRIVAFDPPYVSTGGRKTTTIPDFYSAYGLTEASRTPALLQAYNNVGLGEAARVCQPQGFILAKCADYVSSGRMWMGVTETTNAGRGHGLRVADVFYHLTASGGPQPLGRTRKPRKGEDPDLRVASGQHHTRSNLSVLLLFQKKGRSKR